jgi:hypothetical protein
MVKVVKKSQGFQYFIKFLNFSKVFQNLKKFKIFIKYIFIKYISKAWLKYTRDDMENFMS